MTRITRKLSFFKKNHLLIFGIFWLLLAFGMFTTSAYEDDAEGYRRFVIPGLYLVSAILYFISAFRSKDKKSEYIEWDAERLIVKKQGEKPKEYQLSRLKKLTVATNDLIISAPNARGTMMSLKGYSDEELTTLRNQFDDFNGLKLV